MSSPLLVREAAEPNLNARVPIKHPRRLPSLAAVVFLLPIALLYWEAGGPSGLLADPSSGVHVRTGQWIVAHLAVPRYDLFSYTLARKNWRDWEWLSDVIFATAHRFQGLSGVAALAVALLCLLAVVVYRSARVRAGPIVAGATCALVVATTTIHWLARPHLFTWLALAAFCWLLEGPCNKKKLWIVTAITALWVNLHPGFVAGFLVLGAYLAGHAVNARIGNTKAERHAHCQRVQWSALAIVVCGAATLVNPYGLELHGHILSYLFGSSSVTVQVSEWVSPNFHNLRLAWFEILLPLAAAAGVWHALKRHFYWCVLNFGFMHLALVSVRNVPLFAIVSAAPLAAATEEMFAKFDFGRPLQTAEAMLDEVTSEVATAGVMLFALIMLGAVYASPVALGQGMRIPIEAIEQLPPGRLFTTDHWADYLIYDQPRRKVFFDGRNDFYGPALVQSYLTIMRAEPGWHRTLARYKVSVALVPSGSAISAALRHDSGWQEVNRSGNAATFVRIESSNPKSGKEGQSRDAGPSGEDHGMVQREALTAVLNAVQRARAPLIERAGGRR